MLGILKHQKEYFEEQTWLFLILNTNVLAHYDVDSEQGIIIEWVVLLHSRTAIGGRYFFIFEQPSRGQIIYLCKVTQIINGQSKDYTRCTHTFYPTVLSLPGNGWNIFPLLTWVMWKLMATPFQWPRAIKGLQRQLILVSVSSPTSADLPHYELIDPFFRNHWPRVS